jgi:hypothetical protein
MRRNCRLKWILFDPIDGRLRKGTWKLGALTIGLWLVGHNDAPKAQEALEQATYDCRWIAPAALPERHSNDDVISQLLRAADAYQVSSHLPPSEKTWQQMLGAVNRAKNTLDPDQLSSRERIAAQNAALWIALLAATRLADESVLARSLLHESSRVVAQFALPADQLPRGDAADEIASWLGPSALRVEERLNGDAGLFHEGVYLHTRTFRMVRVGDRHFIFSQLVAIDTLWHPHITPIVGEIEMRTSIASKQRACIAKLDVALGGWRTRSGLRVLDNLPISHLGGYVRVDTAGGTNCLSCHRGGEVLNRTVLDLESADVAAYMRQHSNSSLLQLEDLLALLRSKLLE